MRLIVRSHWQDATSNRSDGGDWQPFFSFPRDGWLVFEESSDAELAGCRIGNDTGLGFPRFPPLYDSYMPPHFRLIFLFSLACLVDPVWAQPGRGPSPVVVAPVIERDVATYRSFIANVNPNRQSTVGSAVDGRVIEFLVKAGQRVEEGQPLAKLRTGTIEIEIAGAKAQLALAQAELDELKNGSRPEEIELAEATAEAAAAADQYAQTKMKRFERLFSSDAGLSQDEFEEAQAAAAAAAANARGARSSLKLTQDGPRREEIDQAAARVAVQQQVVAGLEDRMQKYTIRAPYAGFVSAEHSEAGAWIQQGDPIAEVVEIDPVEIEVYVPEADIRFTRVGGQCDVRVESRPQETFQGKIDQIVPLGDRRARTFPVRVIVANPVTDSGHKLLPGMLARAMLPTDEQSKELLVHKDALRLGDSTTVIRVIDGKAEIVPVRTGASLGSWIVVQSVSPLKLSTDDVVITRGNERLRPGQEVKISQRTPPPES